MKTSWVCCCRATAALAVAGLLTWDSGRSAAADGAEVLKSLEGTWTGTRWDKGKGEDAAKGVALQLTFKGNQVVGTKIPTGDIGEGTVEISEDGGQIDAVGKTGGYRAKAYLGILKIEGDTLYWCTATGGRNQKRPEEFEADPAEHSYLIIVKRKKS